MQLSKKQREDYLKLLLNKGEFGIYKMAVGEAIMKAGSVVDVDLELLNLSDTFFCLARSTGESNFFIIGRSLRKAAHTVFRTLKKLGIERPVSARFLQIINK